MLFCSPVLGKIKTPIAISLLFISKSLNTWDQTTFFGGKLHLSVTWYLFHLLHLNVCHSFLPVQWCVSGHVKLKKDLLKPSAVCLYLCVCKWIKTCDNTESPSACVLSFRTCIVVYFMFLLTMWTAGYHCHRLLLERLLCPRPRWAGRRDGWMISHWCLEDLRTQSALSFPHSVCVHTRKRVFEEKLGSMAQFLMCLKKVSLNFFS